MTPEEIRREHLLCRQPGVAGFLHFCENHVRIQDKIARREVQFRLYPGQRRIAEELCAGTWLWILKGRQLGFTWLIAAFTCYAMLFRGMYNAFNFQQSKEYAKNFIWRIGFIYQRLPPCFQSRLGKRTAFEIEFSHRQSSCVALASGAGAGRSFTADLAVFDEAAYIADFTDTLAASLPSLTGAAAGQMVVLSTARGPGDMFHLGWQVASGATREGEAALRRFKPVFVHWSERPGRDQAWYTQQVADLSMFGAHYVRREYPNTSEEAFEHAEGRCWPAFSKSTHVYKLDLKRARARYRGIDFGEHKSAHVCLWLALYDGPPALVVDPDCTNTIREILGYRVDPDTEKPIKGADHACDALRYAVCTFRLQQTVYVYRERWIEDSVAKGYTELKHVADIHEQSGWVPAPPTSRYHYQRGAAGEEFDGSVADRSRNDTIALYGSMDIPLIGQRRPGPPPGVKSQSDTQLSEKIEGIAWVNLLVDGTLAMTKEHELSAEQAAKREARKRSGLGVRVSPPAGTDEATIRYWERRRAAARRELRRK